MTRTSHLCLVFVLAASAGAQDLLVTNARIITCAGADVELGSVLIKDGRIAAIVSPRSSMVIVSPASMRSTSTWGG